jgi:CYTH domain-containing protein
VSQGPDAPKKALPVGTGARHALASSQPLEAPTTSGTPAILSQEKTSPPIQFMSREIEHKFLVNGAPLSAAVNRLHLVQGYLARENDVSVRVRITDGEHAEIGIKRRLSTTERAEFEFPIPCTEAQQLLGEIAGSRIIEKTRHHLPAGNGLTWEVDVFHGANSGLLLAEIEIPEHGTVFNHPDWLGEEVTNDPRYLNTHLAVHPWPTWCDQPSP